MSCASISFSLLLVSFLFRRRLCLRSLFKLSSSLSASLFPYCTGLSSMRNEGIAFASHWMTIESIEYLVQYLEQKHHLTASKKMKPTLFLSLSVLLINIILSNNYQWFLSYHACCYWLESHHRGGYKFKW